MGGPAISLLDVTTIEEAEEVGDRKFSDEQREIGELRVRKFAADMIGEVEEDEAKSNAQRSLLFALDPWGLEQGEGADPKKKEKTSEDKKAEQRATEKGDEEKKADKPKSDQPKADEVPKKTSPKEDRAKKIATEEKNAVKKKQNEEKAETAQETELKKSSAQMHSQMRNMGISE